MLTLLPQRPIILPFIVTVHDNEQAVELYHHGSGLLPYAAAINTMRVQQVKNHQAVG
jgi:hypothetical protein